MIAYAIPKSAEHFLLILQIKPQLLDLGIAEFSGYLDVFYRRDGDILDSGPGASCRRFHVEKIGSAGKSNGFVFVRSGLWPSLIPVVVKWV